MVESAGGPVSVTAPKLVRMMDEIAEMTYHDRIRDAVMDVSDLGARQFLKKVAGQGQFPVTYVFI